LSTRHFSSKPAKTSILTTSYMGFVQSTAGMGKIWKSTHKDNM
jgi:hypothetical protein